MRRQYARSDKASFALRASFHLAGWKIGKCTLEDFKLGVTLGTGSFGRVRFATHKATGGIWAIKMLKKCEVVRLQQVDHILSEKEILDVLDHPFIVRLGGTFQDDRYLYLAIEYICGGEFFTHLRKATRLRHEDGMFYAAQIVTIFDYLHKQSIIYRDLKPENLLLDERGYFKITDFGFAKRVAFKTWTLCGTPEYIAPEVLLNKGHGKGVDWWTLGILLFEMLAGQPPFVDDDPMGIYNQIIEGKVRFPKYFERGSKSLIKRLLTADLTRRYGCLRRGAEDIMEHKFFLGFDFGKLLGGELPAPIVPTVKDKNDTSNFDPYPEEEDEVPLPEFEGGKDPFIGF